MCSSDLSYCKNKVWTLRYASRTELRPREEAKTECLGQKLFEKAVILQDTSKKS